MNIFTKISAFLLFAVGVYSPLLAQKKLALANECFNAKAYYLASRYYQQAFDKTNNCHPDQIKFAQSLAATNQLSAAEGAFEDYMSCQTNSPASNLAYGKFLMDIKAYERAIPYFERSMEAEPQLARHYILACQTARPQLAEAATTVFVHQEKEPPVPQRQIEAVKEEPPAMTVPTITKQPTINKVQTTTLTASTELDLTTRATNEINLYDAMSPEDKIAETPLQPVITNLTPETPKKVLKEKKIVVKTKSNAIELEKKTSPYGVRLGTYQPTKVPSFSAVENYGKIEQKKWNGKTIVYLVEFTTRAAAEAALKLARQENFRSAILVEKLASGRMKSIR